MVSVLIKSTMIKTALATINYEFLKLSTLSWRMIIIPFHTTRESEKNVQKSRKNCLNFLSIPLTREQTTCFRNTSVIFARSSRKHNSACNENGAKVKKNKVKDRQKTNSPLPAILYERRKFYSFFVISNFSRRRYIFYRKSISLIGT